MFLEESTSAQDGLAVMARAINEKLDRKVYERVIQLSQGALTGSECAEEHFRFVTNLGFGALELTFYKEILYSSQGSPYLSYSVSGVETRGYLDDPVGDFLMLDVVLRVEELHKAPLNELKQLDKVIGEAAQIIAQAQQGGRNV